MDSHLLIRIWIGKLKKHELIWLCCVSLGLSTLSMFISWILYPTHLNYSIFKDTLSYLGDYIRNPQGWYFFSIGMVIMGLTFFSLTFYIYHRIKYTSKIVARLSTLFLILGSVFTILVAFFPDVYGEDFIEDVSKGKVHNIIAMIAIFSILIGLIIQSVIFIIDHYPKIRQTEEILFADLLTRPVYFLLAIIGIMMLISVLYLKLGHHDWPGPGILSFTFWEWMLSLNYIIIYYRISLGLPNKLPQLSTRSKESGTK